VIERKETTINFSLKLPVKLKDEKDALTKKKKKN
jgi:hypothetical protein